MFLRRVIPVLQLEGNRLYKTRRFEDKVYIGDPINVVQILNKKSVNELMLLNIASDRFVKTVDFTLLKDISNECFMPVTYGGGVTNLDQIEKLLSIGFEKIVINTRGVEDNKFLRDAVKNYGSSTIVCSVDYRINSGERIVYTNSGSIKIERKFIDIISDIAKCDIGEIVLTNIDKDGTFSGYDLDVIDCVNSSLNIPLIINGGASNLTNMTDAVKRGVQAVAAGSLFSLRMPHRAVLISYPNEELINKMF